MNGGIELAIHQADCLVPLFRVFVAKRRQNHMVVRCKNLCAKIEPQPVLETIGFVLGGVELELHVA
jgi:hypothetical protein